MGEATAGVWIKAPRPGSYLIGGQLRLASAVAWCETDPQVIKAAEQEPGFVVTRPEKETPSHGVEEESRRAREEHEAAPLHRQPEGKSAVERVRVEGQQDRGAAQPPRDEKRAEKLARPVAREEPVGRPPTRAARPGPKPGPKARGKRR